MKGITPVTTGKGSWLFVEVPDDALEIEYWDYDVRRPYIDFESPKNFYRSIQLPYIHPGSYKFLATTKGISKEDAAKIVDRVLDVAIRLFVNYNKGEHGVFDYAPHSLQSLLRSHELNPELNYAILQKL